jgi:PAS domain S-box-containing protein
MLADNMVDMVLLHDKDFNRLYVSPSCYRLTGYTVDEYMEMQRALNVFYGPADQEIVRVTQQKIALNGGLETVRYCLRHKSGEKIYVEAIVKGLPDETGKTAKFLLTIRNVTKQAQAEIALRASEEQYRMLADNMADMVVLLDANLGWLYVSPSSASLLGYTADALTAGPPDAKLFYSDEDYQIIRDAQQKIAAGSPVEKVVYKLRHKNGSKIIAEATAKGIFNEKGVIANYLFTIRNVTQQTEAEQALRKSEEQYRILADNIGDMVVLLSLDQTRLYVSPSCKQLLGYAPEELVGKKFDASVVYLSEDLSRVRAAQQQILSGAKQASVRFSVKHKNGSKIAVEVNIKGVNDTAGALSGYLMAARDVTQQTEAENALRKSEEQ